MPVFLEPGLSFPVVLESDKDKPAETQPTFLAKSQAMRGQQKICNVLDRLTTDKDVTAEQLFNDVVDTLGQVLVGWKNMNDIPYSVDALRDVLTYNEARELLRKVAYNQHVTLDEKKSSE